MPIRTRAGRAADNVADMARSQTVWITPVVLLCFVTSGAASLILESTLTRLLRLTLGNTALAVTTVLCAFMGGLALGGFIGGRISERTCRPLRSYALLEGAIGLSCLLLPLAIHTLQPVYRWLYLHVEDSFLLLSLVRFVFCGLLLLIPTTFMGATLPILSRWYAARTDRTGRAIAWLYAANSLGAAAGVLLCAFLLLPGLGLTATLRLACLMAFSVCLAGLLLDRSTTPIAVAAPVAADRSSEAKPPVRRSGLEIALLLTYGLSGAAALIYEVAWTRVLCLMIGSSVYAFSLMLAAFILGLALGSALISRFVDRIRDPVTGFAAAELGIALTALAAVPLLGQLPIAMVRVFRTYAHSFAALQTVEFAIIVLIMIVPTTLMGAAFVLVGRACMSISNRVGRTIGGIYCANTLGGVIGAFTATFLWIPWIGTRNTILLASAANLAIAVFFLLPGLRRISWRWTATSVAGVGVFAAAAVWLPPWDAALMSAGPYLYANEYVSAGSATAGDIRRNMRATRVIFHREDIGGTVTVREGGMGERALVISGKADASNIGDFPSQMLVGHVPLLLHPHPRTVLVVGLASGVTLGASATHPLERIDCVEISRAVVQASHYFNDINGHVLADPRVRLILGDGRNHVALTDRTYDVIISEPSNPWLAGVADLFTLEYFQACRSRLNPGGIACVWLQAYNVEDAVFRSVVRTFHEVFPHMVVMEASVAADYMLIGSDQPLRVPYAELVRRLAAPSLAASLARVDIDDPLDLIQLITLSSRFDEYTAGALLHTDDSVMLEFATPRTLYDDSQTSSILAGMQAFHQPDIGIVAFDAADKALQVRLQQDLARRLQARDLARAAVMLWYNGSFDQAVAAARKAFELEPAGCDPLLQECRGLLARARQQQAAGNLEEAIRLTVCAASLAPHLLAANIQFADLMAQSGKWTDAVYALRIARTRAPDDRQVLHDLAWMLATAPDAQVRNGTEALQLAEQLCAAGTSQRPQYLATLAAAYAEAGRFADAVGAATNAADLASSGNDPVLAGQIQEQLAAYRQGRPWRQAPSH